MKSEPATIPLTNTAAAMLRDFLEDHGLSQAKLAADLHISPQLLKDILAKRKTGTLGGTSYTLTLANGGLKVAYNPGYKLPAAVKVAAEAAIQGISKGSIKVQP